MTKTIDIEFLESKLFSCKSKWAQGETTLCRSSHGNIDRISADVFRFKQYNFLPTSQDGKTTDPTDVLDGHFTFYVNSKTFEYLVYKSSDYGSFTYTIPVEFNDFYTKENLPEISRKRIESVIAHKLLTAYFQSSKAVNRNGANLFSTNEIEKDGEFIRYNDGIKNSLICDYRGYIWTDLKIQTYSLVDLAALKTLQNWEQPQIEPLPDNIVKSLRAQLTRKTKSNTEVVEMLFKGFMVSETNNTATIEINGVEFLILHTSRDKYVNESFLLYKGYKIANYISKHSLTKFLRCIPEILNNYSTDLFVFD